MTVEVERYEGTFEGARGAGMFERRWRPGGRVKGAVVLVHGLKDHSGRYDHVAEHLARRGYAVHALDLRGHGRSGGRRYFVESFEEYVDDLDFFLARVRKTETHRPVFLLGHSMGGTIVCLHSIMRGPELRGIVLSAPGLEAGPGVSLPLIYLVRLLGRALPRLPAVRLDVEKISRDPEVVRAAREDPLSDHWPSPARLGSELLRAMGGIQARASEISSPLLVMHGAADSLANPEGSTRFVEAVSSPDKTLRFYDGLYHEIFNEPEREKVLSDLTEWLDARV